MSFFHYAIYGGLGLTLFVLGAWRIRRSSSAGSLRPAGLLIGATILTVIAASLLGVVSLDGVEACLNTKGGGRSKLLTCLVHVQMTSR
jgi:hypothetical protein